MVFRIFQRTADKSAYVLAEIAKLDEQTHHDLHTYAIGRDFWLGMALVHTALSGLIVLLFLVL